MSDIQDWFLKKHETVTDNPSIICIHKIENRITIQDIYLERLMSETIKLLGSTKMSKTMKLVGSTKSKMTRDKSGKNVPCLEITELLLIHYNIVNNNYQQDLRVL